jgi:hypothetical protein
MARSRASGSTRARTRRTVASPGGCQTAVRRSRRVPSAARNVNLMYQHGPSHDLTEDPHIGCPEGARDRHGEVRKVEMPVGAPLIIVVGKVEGAANLRAVVLTGGIFSVQGMYGQPGGYDGGDGRHQHIAIPVVRLQTHNRGQYRCHEDHHRPEAHDLTTEDVVPVHELKAISQLLGFDRHEPPEREQDMGTPAQAQVVSATSYILVSQLWKTRVARRNETNHARRPVARTTQTRRSSKKSTNLRSSGRLATCGSPGSRPQETIRRGEIRMIEPSRSSRMTFPPASSVTASPRTSTARGRPDGSASSTRRPERGTDGVAWPRALLSCATRRSILACLASSTVMALSAALCSSSVIASGFPLASPALRAFGGTSLRNPSFRTYWVPRPTSRTLRRHRDLTQSASRRKRG